jgi:hypothetical protein
VKQKTERNMGKAISLAFSVSEFGGDLGSMSHREGGVSIADKKTNNPCLSKPRRPVTAQLRLTTGPFLAYCWPHCSLSASGCEWVQHIRSTGHHAVLCLGPCVGCVSYKRLQISASPRALCPGMCLSQETLYKVTCWLCSLLGRL